MKKYLLKKTEQRKLFLKDRLLFEFYKTMMQNDYEYEYLNNNIKSLKISPIRFAKLKFKKSNAIAYYDSNKNKIKYVKSKKEKSLPHELMHMSSTIKEEDGSIFSGFSQKTKDGEFLLIGNGFNEGYTQLLSERYFPNAVNIAYPIEKLVAFQLEDILGTDEDIVTRGLEEELEKRLLYSEIKNLKERDKKIMIMRYGLYGTHEYTQKEVASMMNISQSYISRIEKKIIARLKVKHG